MNRLLVILLFSLFSLNIVWDGSKSLPNEEPGLCEVVHVEETIISEPSEPDAYMTGVCTYSE